MIAALEDHLHRWQDHGLLEPAQVQGILAFEGRLQAAPAERLRLPAILALAFGALMVSAGVLLFVAAHWAALSPGTRFAAVLAMVGVFHVGGALAAGPSPRLATALHGVGTVLLGAGIFLAGQIFNLQEHWPGGVLLWALGAWLGLALLRDWVQGVLGAVLTPFWLAGEWLEATRGAAAANGILAAALFLLALAYLTLRLRAGDSLLRKALAWVGGLALMPATAFVVGVTFRHGWQQSGLSPSLRALGWGAALGGPLALAAWTRGRRAWVNAAAMAWMLALGLTHGRPWAPYLWLALGAACLTLWGLQEGRRERVNLGVAGFALNLLAFYFANVMDQLGRSLGLMMLGVLFLGGGWQLERVRRKLNALIGRGGQP